MKTYKAHAILGSALALALVACGESPVEEADTAGAETAQTAAVADFDPLSRDYTLSPEAKARRDAFDQDAFETEYAGYRDAMMKESAGNAGLEESGNTAANADKAASSNDTASSKSATTSGNVATSSGGTMSGDAQGGSRGMGNSASVMQRGAMDWSYLDRNDDGKLSAAEYAIWAVPLNPTQPLPNDEKAPYLTADQINSAADSFFYYDVNGDTYLSESEFKTARTGGDVTM